MTDAEIKGLLTAVNEAIAQIVKNRSDVPGPVNWADLSCSDILVSVLYPDRWPIVVIEEASPTASEFQIAIAEALEHRGFPNIEVQTEW